VNEANLIIIPNGIDLDRFSRDDNVRVAMRRELHRDDEFLWLAIGRLDPVKDHSTLLRAFSMLPVSARLIIAGSGPMLSHLASLARELGLGSRVRLLGFQPDILRWLRAADGFVLCSRWEGLPIALLEASACELPSIVTDIAGAREVLADSLPTLPVPVGDAEALAVSMQHLMSLTVSDRRECGLCARNSVASRFSLDGVLNRWEALYGELLEANPHPRRFGSASLSPGRTLQLQ
jgi:glycosyltransferase involved in cell wall biosynthesis